DSDYLGGSLRDGRSQRDKRAGPRKLRGLGSQRVSSLQDLSPGVLRGDPRRASRRRLWRSNCGAIPTEQLRDPDSGGRPFEARVNLLPFLFFLFAARALAVQPPRYSLATSVLCRTSYRVPSKRLRLVSST